MHPVYFLLFVIFPLSVFSQPQQPYSSSDIQLALKKLNTVGSVLYIAAHPDDENTRLLSYLANEKLLRTAYLSVTRGDGGQNLIGSEQEELLGIIRTQELLAARRIDRAEQFFTRAIDFGYSKTPEETFSIWDKEKILSDVVWIIRNFQPDIIITRFSANAESGHGHHTASAILAEEAFKAAADANRFPEQLKYVSVWNAKRLLWNNFIPRDSKIDTAALLKLDVGVFNPLLGKSYGEIAGESRSMHKSQGFGASRNRGSMVEYFKHIAGDSATKNIFEGIDFSWKRIKNGEKTEKPLSQALAQFQPEKPELTIPVLLEALREIQKLPGNAWTAQKKKEIENLIVACSGIWAETNAAHYSATPNSWMKITASFVMRNSLSCSLEKIIFPNSTDTLLQKSLRSNEQINIDKRILIDAHAPFTNPYWLEEKHGKGTFTVSNQMQIGMAESTPPLYVSFLISFGNQSLVINRPVQYKWLDPVEGELYRPFEIVPAVTANFSEKALVFPNGESKEIAIMLKSAVDSAGGNLSLQLPDGWKTEPLSIPFHLKIKGEEQTVTFRISPVQQSAFSSGIIKAVLSSSPAKSITRIEHKHIPHLVLFRDAESKAVSFSIVKKSKKIGYIAGAGDEVADGLRQIGYEVTMLTDEMLNSQSLSGYDAIIAGIRAYNTNERMKFHYKKLMDYIFNGGNMVVQYNTNNFLSSVKAEIGPYPFRISRERVTVEEAPIVFDNPNHAILNFPNKITEKDFEGWIQERGLYFANEWDEKYETVISCNDPGEKPLKGSVLVAKHGKGNFVYTGLAFFRQLPAGVPGVYRLFVNMIELRK